MKEKQTKNFRAGADHSVHTNIQNPNLLSINLSLSVNSFYGIDDIVDSIKRQVGEELVKRQPCLRAKKTSLVAERRFTYKAIKALEVELLLYDTWLENEKRGGPKLSAAKLAEKAGLQDYFRNRANIHDLLDKVERIKTLVREVMQK